MTTVWNDDQRFKNTYFHKFGSNYSYTTLIGVSEKGWVLLYFRTN